MLVLSRSTGESIRLNDEVVVTVIAIQGGRVRLGIAAPASVRIARCESPVDLPGPETVTLPADGAPMPGGEPPACAGSTRRSARGSPRDAASSRARRMSVQPVRQTGLNVGEEI